MSYSVSQFPCPRHHSSLCPRTLMLSPHDHCWIHGIHTYLSLLSVYQDIHLFQTLWSIWMMIALQSELATNSEIFPARATFFPSSQSSVLVIAKLVLLHLSGNKCHNVWVKLSFGECSYSEAGEGQEDIWGPPGLRTPAGTFLALMTPYYIWPTA